MSLSLFGWVACGGALGALLRFALGEWARSSPRVPGWAAVTLANLLGCSLLGLGMLWSLDAAAAGLSAARVDELRAFGLAGFCGALTTFSAFGLDTALLWYEGRRATAALNVLGTVVAGIATLEWLLLFDGAAS